MKKDKTTCKYYGKCGSCKLYELNYNEQLEYKQKKVKKVFNKLNRSLERDTENQHVLFDTNQVPLPIPAPNLYRYRNKVEFTFFTTKNNTVGVGYHEKGQFNKLINIDDCLLMKERNNEILDIARNWANENKVPAYQKKTHKGILRYIIIRDSVSTGEKLITLVTDGGSEEMLKPLIDSFLANKIPLKGFIWARHSEFADAAIISDSTLLYGDDFIIDTIGDKTFQIPYDSFFQVNNDAAKLLYDKIKSYVHDDDTVMDLFCGAGTISAYIADKTKHILGIEIVDSAIKQAEKNMQLNGIKDKTEFISGKVRENISKIRFDNEFNLIILDPPRSGTDKHTMRHIGKRQPEKIVYVACGLGELAFNLKSVMDFGYKVAEVSSVDMFPWTPHVEVIVYLEKI